MDDLKEVGEVSHSSQKIESSSEMSESSSPVDPEKTVAVSLAGRSQLVSTISSPTSSKTLPPEGPSVVESVPEVKVSYGVKRAAASPGSVEHHLKQADNLSLAQSRILDLEKQLDAVRLENDQLTSSMDVARTRLEDNSKKLAQLEKAKLEIKEQAAIEQAIYRENIQARDYQIDRLKQKIEELEVRLNMDMKKIRVRERELENRLELSKAEKNALVRSKDDHILDLKRKSEQMTSELSEANAKIQDLLQKIESNQDQFARTVRALRLALTNLEAHEETSSVNLTHIKKAE